LTKVVIVLYLIVFSLYVLFSRQPDFFDGEHTIATIHFTKTNNENIAKADFSINKINYAVDVNYLFKNFKEGEKADLLYDNQNPQNAALYSIWGYWLRWQELSLSLVLLIGLFQVAVQITNNPTPEALIQELEGRKRVKKKKYDN
jgi:ribonucleotide reductase alpha subunit